MAEDQARRTETSAIPGQRMHEDTGGGEPFVERDVVTALEEQRNEESR
ncbi:hypothetical protein [Frankia sp. AgKG'84/4]|nr:hypothetical protein [Frankia sp. AgKG'84/4]MCL9795864.1 hypothetical protein [Frankia sp. AgKG'84/4]